MCRYRLHRSSDVAGISDSLLLQLQLLLFLGGCHATLAAQKGKAAAVDELGIAAAKEIDVAGVVLGFGKGLEAVSDKILIEGYQGQEGVVNPLSPAGEPLDAILNQFIADVQLPGDIPIAGGCFEGIHDGGIIDGLLYIVIQGEGLGAKGPSTVIAAVSLYIAISVGAVITVFLIPMG